MMTQEDRALGHILYRRTLLESLQATARYAFGDAVCVVIERPEPELHDHDEPIFRLTLRNATRGLLVDLYRGHWAQCVQWIKRG